MSEPAKKRPRLGDSLRTSNNNFSQLFTSQDLNEEPDLRRSGLLFSSIDKPSSDPPLMGNSSRSANALDLRSSTGLDGLGLSQTWSEFDFGRELGSSTAFTMPAQPSDPQSASATSSPVPSEAIAPPATNPAPSNPPPSVPAPATGAPPAPYASAAHPGANPPYYSSPFNPPEFNQYPGYYYGQNPAYPPAAHPPQPPPNRPGSFSGDVTTSTPRSANSPPSIPNLPHHPFPHHQPHHQPYHPHHQPAQPQQQNSPHPPWFAEYMFRIAPSQTQAELTSLQEKFKHQLKKQMEMIKDDLKSDIPIDRKGDNLESLISNTESELNRIRNHLDQLFEHSILPPLVLNGLVSLKRQVGIEIQQLWLYKCELKYYRDNMSGSVPFGFLVLAKQPFPKPVKKNIKVCGSDGAHEEPTLVRLLSFSGTKVTPSSKVKASVIFEDCHENATFISDSVDMDEHGFASFYSLKFDKATRKRVAKLQFSMDAQITTPKGNIQIPIQSESSAPFIVFTNESQWEESESILLKKDCFVHSEITFERLANFLQIHFLRSTRQDPTKPDRGLSIHDLNYLARQKLDNKRMLTKSDVDKFMTWFGKVVRRIRHHQSFHALWVKGLVYGFISRSEANALLGSKPSGTFLIRFSESAESKVVISSVHGEGENRKFEHMLVAPRVNETHTRLLDVLKKGKKWTHTVVIGPEFDPSNMQDLALQEKDKVFTEHYGKQQKSDDLPDGYLLDDGELNSQND